MVVDEGRETPTDQRHPVYTRARACVSGKGTHQSERRQGEALGSAFRVVCYVNLLRASRGTSQRKNYPWKWVHADWLGPSTRPSKIFSSLSLDSTTICIRSLSLSLSVPFFSFLSSYLISFSLFPASPRILLQRVVLPFGPPYEIRSSSRNFES